MNANQVYSLVNGITAEVLGKSAITVKDTAGLVSLGNTILSTDTNKDAFYSKLADRIGKVYIKYRKYVTDARKTLYMSPLDFGIALQKVQTKTVAPAVENNAWKNQSNPFAKSSDTTDIEQRIFSKLGTWEVETKIVYDYQLKTAFVNEQNFASFTNLIFNDMYNAMELQLEATANLCRATAIAQCIKGSKSSVKRNLLAEFKAIFTDSTLTADDCLYDVDFLKYATREINLVTKRMQKMTSLFVPAGAYDRFTDKSDIVVDVLTDFGTASTSYLQADTFHKELVALPMYNEVPYWQGTGTAYDFESTSKIHITDEAEDETEQSGIIAFVRDKEVCGCLIDNIRTKSIYNPASECTNYFHKADWGMYVDPTEQAVVFYVAD